jgi:hypothetical protein
MILSRLDNDQYAPPAIELTDFSKSMAFYLRIEGLTRIIHESSSRGGAEGRGYKACDRGPRRRAFQCC